MSALAEKPLEFKFKWLDKNGQETGFRSKKGQFDGEMLTLEDTPLPALAIADVQIRERIMVVSVMQNEGPPAVVGFGAAPGVLTKLKTALDTARSGTWARLHREKLQKEGRGHEYRDGQCPQCGATVILSNMPQTPQLYCHFCDTLTTLDDSRAPAGERDLRLCGECGMFSRPQKYTVFYFVFVLVAYWYHYYPTWRCPACMRKTAWKMMAGNLLFVLGIAPSAVQLARSYGGSIRGPFAGLDKSNLKARKGDILGALAGYRAILGRVPHSAGLKYNVGLALLQQNDVPRAADAFRIALDDCGNYVPAYHRLAACYQQLGETERLTELQTQWGTLPAQEEEPAEPVF